MTREGLPPARADHAGSLLRPPALLEARAQHARAAIGAGQFARAMDSAIAEAVAIQELAGMPVVTDGEYRRQYWNFDFFAAIGNVEFTEHAPEQGRPPQLSFTGPLTRPTPIFADAFATLSRQTSRIAKMTLPSPGYLLGREQPPGVAAAGYHDLDAFCADVAGVYQQEIAGLAAAGCTYLQLDDPNFAFLCDPAHRDRVRPGRGEGYHRLLQRYARVINEGLRGRPAGMTITMHTCRGNYRSMSFAEGGYEPVADLLFNDIDVDGYLLEYHAPRCGDFAPLRLLPAGKFAVLGVVSTKTGKLEDAAALMRRIDAAARFVPLERLAVSPQCGFASTAEGNLLSAGEQAAKLRLVAELAAQIWS